MVCIYYFSARWCSVNCTQSTSQTLTVLFSYYELPAFFLFLSSYSSAKYGAMDLASYRSPAQSNFSSGNDPFIILREKWIFLPWFFHFFTDLQRPGQMI